MHRVGRQANLEDIRLSIEQFLVDQFPSARRAKLDGSTPLLENGIIDSLGVLDLIAQIETEFGIVVDDEELAPENFGSINRLSGYVERKRDNSR